MLLLFQAKLVKYKAEAVDSGEQVEQLTTQARIDQETIRNLQSKVEDQNQQLQTQKVSFKIKIIILSKLQKLLQIKWKVFQLKDLKSIR